jgi:cytochrome P450
MATGSAFDPFNAAQAQNAWDLLAELRAEGPVAAIASGMQYVTRYSECRGVLRDVGSFSNASGLKAPGVVIPPEDRLLGELDPPRHTLVRRVMVTALTPSVVRGAEGFMAASAEALLDRLLDPLQPDQLRPDRPAEAPAVAGASTAVAGASTADLVSGFTVPLPNRVTVHLLGLPPEDADRLAAWAKELMESGFPATNRSDRGEGFAAAFPDFASYIDGKIDERATELAGGRRPEGVLTRLLELEVEGEPLPRRQVRALVRNLITGGLTTTSQLLGNVIHQLLTAPALETRLRADLADGSSEILDRAIDESLRLSPPVLFIARGCVQDTSVDGCPIETGRRLIVGTASANRDDRVFDDADRFDVDRANADQHLTFGYGAHVCPGATLARTEARIGITALLSRFPPGTIRLAPGFEYENVPTFFECGPRRLPVVRG